MTRFCRGSCAHLPQWRLAHHRHAVDERLLQIRRIAGRFENSDWALLLQQKAESIADVRKNARLT
jgi:hypothetical protein